MRAGSAANWLRAALTPGLQEFSQGQFQRFVRRDLPKGGTDGFTGRLYGAIVGAIYGIPLAATSARPVAV